jgi:molecular chaperone GrpE
MPSSPGTDRHDTASGAPSIEEPEAPERREPSQAEHEAEIARLEDRYKRALADLDNYRKRSAREVERRVEEARDALLREWLEAVDTVERAARMDPDGPLGQGMRALLDQIEALLARRGVQRIGEAGEPFDPERHDAVEVRVTTDAPENTVVDVIRAGYAVDGRVLRPAQVAVARRPQTSG